MDLQPLRDRFPAISIQLNESLAHYTYTKTGGKADAVAFPKSRQEIFDLLAWVKDEGVPLTVLGNASNLIVRDGGIRGLVMILTELKGVEIRDYELTVASGESLIEVCRIARDYSLTGLEFASGIPGSIGGAIYMNAGAYGGEVRDVIDTVEAMDRQGNIKVYTNPELDFSYRHSAFQNNDEIILGVTFKLEPGEIDQINAEMDRVRELREAKQPLEYPSCGSVFKRPVGHYTGKLIQDAGLQGYQIGGAQISKKHAGFIVNIDHATATDYVDLIQFIQDTIMDKYQVQLETEVRIIGEEL